MRRKVIEERVNHERWLISYADFITLLFAFFVVMYSISQVNESKYRVLSDTLTDAFNSHSASPERNLKPIQIGEEARSNPIHLIKLEDPALVSNEQRQTSDADEQEADFSDDTFEEITHGINDVFADLVDTQLLNVRGNEEWLEIELSASLLFSSGDAQLSNDSLEVLSKITTLLKDNDKPIKVEGFTDNIPINNIRFPSNWELSAARAAAVVQLFIEEGIAPRRLAAIGYGEHQPIESNDTVEGRNRNRRIVLMLSKVDQLRPELSSQETPAAADIEAPPASPLQGVEKVELQGGGLLFTNDPERANLLR